MPATFNNPSFESPGGQPGLPLDWSYTVVSSLYQYVNYVRGVATIVVAYYPVDADELLGVEIQVQEDGTTYIISAPGSTETFDGFEFGWNANHFYAFALNSSLVDTALISGAKLNESFEDGWLNDVGFLDDLGVLATESFTEAFEGGFPASAPALLKTEFAPIEFGLFEGSGFNTFFDGAALAAPNYANDLRAFYVRYGNSGVRIRAQNDVGNIIDELLINLPTAGKQIFSGVTGIGSTQSNIIVSGVALVPDGLIGLYARIGGEYRKIIANTAVSFQVERNFTTIPAGGVAVEVGVLFTHAYVGGALGSGWAGHRDMVEYGAHDFGLDGGTVRWIGDPGADLVRAEFT